MKADERKKRIMEHLARSSEGLKFLSPKQGLEAPFSEVSPRLNARSEPTPVPDPTPPPTTPPQAGERERQIMNHVNRTTNGEIGQFFRNKEQRIKQIQAHVRKSQE
jgi:hypothetical protein